MRQDSLKLAPIHRPEESCRNGYDRMLFIATCSEGVRCRVADDVDARLRETRSYCKIFNHSMKLAILVFVCQMSARGSDRHFVRKPIRPDVHNERKGDRTIEDHRTIKIIGSAPADQHHDDQEST